MSDECFKEDQGLYYADELYAWIIKRRDSLKKVIEQKEKEVKQYSDILPQGTIRASYSGKNHTREQYYWREQSYDKSGKYVKKTPENQKFLKMMIQREYDQKIIKAVRGEYKYLQAGQQFSSGDSISRVFKSMGTLKQKWISPVLLSDAEYARIWRKQSFNTSSYKNENKLYKTRQGENVRSKSELIIANALFEHKIPYRYECPLIEKKRIWTLPDFTVLNVRRRKEYYWEHFGMMGNPNYVQKALKKIRDYEKHHKFPGIDIIYTFESSEISIDPEIIEEIIENYFI